MILSVGHEERGSEKAGRLESESSLLGWLSLLSQRKLKAQRAKEA